MWQILITWDGPDQVRPMFSDVKWGISDNFEVSHHSLIFMLKLMAVHQIPDPISIKADKDLNGLAIVE